MSTSWTLPLTDLALSEEDVAAYLAVLDSGWLTMGPRTREFETRVRASGSARRTRWPCPRAPRHCTSRCWPPASAPATRSSSRR